MVKLGLRASSLPYGALQVATFPSCTCACHNGFRCLNAEDVYSVKSFYTDICHPGVILTDLFAPDAVCHCHTFNASLFVDQMH